MEPAIYFQRLGAIKGVQKASHTEQNAPAHFLEPCGAQAIQQLQANAGTTGLKCEKTWRVLNPD